MSADGRRLRFLRFYSTSVRTPLLVLVLLFFSPTRARLSAASATEMLAPSIASWPSRGRGVVLMLGWLAGAEGNMQLLSLAQS